VLGAVGLRGGVVNSASQARRSPVSVPGCTAMTTATMDANGTSAHQRLRSRASQGSSTAPVRGSATRTAWASTSTT